MDKLSIDTCAITIEEAPKSAEACWALLSLADEEEVKHRLDLIAVTHSDERPDPLDDDYYCDYEYDERDKIAWIQEDGRNQAGWNTYNVQEYRADFIALGFDKQRIKALINGAKPTPEERISYRNLVIAKINAIPELYLLDICRVTVPEELGEYRAIYFIREGAMLHGQPTDESICTGPWRDMSEVVDWLRTLFREPYCTYSFTNGKLPSDEKAVLSDWLSQKQADDDARYDAWLKTQE